MNMTAVVTRTSGVRSSGSGIGQPGCSSSFESAEESPSNGARGDAPGSGSYVRRTLTQMAGRRPSKKADADALSSFSAAPVGAEGSQSSFTIFISCSALIRETKLCVGAELQTPLDELLQSLASKGISTETAVK